MLAPLIPDFPCTWTSFQNRFFSAAVSLYRDASPSEAGSSASLDCEMSLNSDDGVAGALGGGPWAVTGCATADLNGDEWMRRHNETG